jgi:hypothetical protein
LQICDGSNQIGTACAALMSGWTPGAFALNAQLRCARPYAVGQAVSVFAEYETNRNNRENSRRVGASASPRIKTSNKVQILASFVLKPTAGSGKVEASHLGRTAQGSRPMGLDF